MRGFVAATFLALLALPIASAQAPDPGAAVALACAAVGGPAPDVRDALPVCPRDEPAAPAAAGEEAEEAHDHGATAPEPASDAQELADEATGAVGDIAEDPASAPGRLAALAAAVRQFVEDLLGLPAAGIEVASAGIAGVASAASAAAGFAGHAALSVADDASGLVTAAVDGIQGALDVARGLLQAWLHEDARADAVPSVDTSVDRVPLARGLAERVLSLTPIA